MTRPKEQPPENTLEKFRGYCEGIFAQLQVVEAADQRLLDTPPKLGMTDAEARSRGGGTVELLSLMSLGITDFASAKRFLIETARELMESGRATPLEIATAIKGTPVAVDHDVLLGILASVPLEKRKQFRITREFAEISQQFRAEMSAIATGRDPISPQLREDLRKAPKLPGEDVIE